LDENKVNPYIAESFINSELRRRKELKGLVTTGFNDCGIE
jgi:hypothetical protein